MATSSWWDDALVGNQIPAQSGSSVGDCSLLQLLLQLLPRDLCSDVGNLLVQLTGDCSLPLQRFVDLSGHVRRSCSRGLRCLGRTRRLGRLHTGGGMRNWLSLSCITSTSSGSSSVLLLRFFLSCTQQRLRRLLQFDKPIRVSNCDMQSRHSVRFGKHCQRRWLLTEPTWISC